MMEYKGYYAKVEFDDDANIFHGEVINLRDVVTFQGVDDLVITKLCEMSGQVDGGPIVYLDDPDAVHLSPDGNEVVVCSAKVNHAAIGIEAEHGFLAGHDELAVHLCGDQLC